MSEEKKCPNCGSLMAQTGTAGGKMCFHCKGCGHDLYVEMTAAGHSDFEMKRAQLLNRTAKSVIGTDVGQWDHLQRDILDFIGRYEQARQDVHLQMALVACITHGFRNMDSDIYKQTKQMFKITEKIYKAHLKAIKRLGHGEIQDVEQYEEYRVLYKKCRNEYRNTKAMWKVAMSLGKIVIKGI